MVGLSELLKTKRQEKALNIEELATELELSKSTISEWENGKSIPSIKTIHKIAAFFGLEVKGLLELRGIAQNKTEIETENFDNEVHETPMPYLGEVRRIETPKIIMIPLVTIKAKASYLAGFGDTEYLETLPKIPMLEDRPRHGNYICFEVDGDSMDDESKNGYQHGDILYTRQISRVHWQSRLHIKDNDFVIVHREFGIVFKQISKHDTSTGIITCHSLNPNYKDFEVFLDEVHLLYNVIKMIRDKK